MNRIYDVIKAMGTDPASFFKQVARGEIDLIIESAAGDQLKPSLEFWWKVIIDNQSSLSDRNEHKYLEFTWRYSKLEITQEALNRLDMVDRLARKNIFFSVNRKDGFVLPIQNIYTDYTPTQANHAPADTVQADQPKLQTIQARGELATKINRAIVDFGNSEYYLKHREGTQKQLILDWLNQQGFNGRQQDVIKTLISEHYNIKSK